MINHDIHIDTQTLYKKLIYNTGNQQRIRRVS